MDIDREELLSVFLSEAKEQLDALEEALLRLEQSPKDSETLNLLFRSAHTLKGNAGIVQLTSVESFAHSLEDVLERVRAGVIPATPDLISLLLRAIDAFRRIIPLATDGIEDPQPEHADLLAWLKAKRYSGGRSFAGARPRDASGRFISLRHLDAMQQTGSVSLTRAPLVPSHHREQRTLRIEVQKLDRMLNLVGEITVARSRLASLMAAEPRASLDEIRNAHHDADRLYLELQEQLMRARMVPLGPTFRRCLRLVRDLAREQGKDAVLLIEGEDVEVDTAVVEGITDPLTHMIRNAIDHGIETPDVRRACGKPPCGNIVLTASHEGGNIIISIADDGRGIDRERVLERGRAMGLIAADEQPSSSSLFKLIFHPGFSTTEAVSEISGRGVGMNVVQKNIEALRGSVAVTSEPQAGTTITLRLPLTLAIIECFSVVIGADTYVLPLDAVVECVDLPSKEQGKGFAQGVIYLRGQPLPYVRLGQLLDLPSQSDARESLVVLQHEGSRAAIAVDALHGAGQTVIKPLGPLVDHSPLVAGCALLGSGKVALILDVPALFRSVTRDSDVGSQLATGAA